MGYQLKYSVPWQGPLRARLGSQRPGGDLSKTEQEQHEEESHYLLIVSHQVGGETQVASSASLGGILQT